MAYDVITFVLDDAEADTRNQTIPIYVPAGEERATLQAIADAFAPEIDALTESRIIGINVSLALTIVGGVKTDPVAAAYNERGGLISLETDSVRNDSIRIPAITHTLMPGNEFSVADTDVAALVARLTSAQTYNSQSIRPVTAQEHLMVDSIAGKKSVRKR